MFRRKLFPFFLLGAGIYYLILIFKASFVIDGQRYFVLFDDMMISMRYANNLVLGNGLVWNIGERIEGFSNLLWTLFMALVHLAAFPLPYTSLVIQLVGALFMLGTLYFVKRIAEQMPHATRFTVWASLVFTAFYFPLVNWSVVLGTEVSILTCITLIVAFLARDPRKHLVQIFPLLLLGFLVRIDYLVIVGVFVIYLLTVKDLRRGVIMGGIIMALVIVVYFYMRKIYYGDFLPNTYYLKATGYPLLPRVIRGLYVLPGLMNELIAFLVLVTAVFSRNKYIYLLVSMFLAQVLYSVYVGGDAWEFLGGANRYIAVAMPLFFILLSYSFTHVQSLLRQSFLRSFQYKLLRVSIVGVIFLSLNSMSDNTLLQLTLIKDPIIKLENKRDVGVANVLLETTSQDARIAVTNAGIVPYFMQDYTFIDLLGKNDAYIARLEARRGNEDIGKLRSWVQYWPGHMKWDNAYSIGKLKSDVVVSVLNIADAQPFLERGYSSVLYRGVGFAAKIGSEKIKWDKFDSVTNYSK